MEGAQTSREHRPSPSRVQRRGTWCVSLSSPNFAFRRKAEIPHIFDFHFHVSWIMLSSVKCLHALVFCYGNVALPLEHNLRFDKRICDFYRNDDTRQVTIPQLSPPNLSRDGTKPGPASARTPMYPAPKVSQKHAHGAGKGGIRNSYSTRPG